MAQQTTKRRTRTRVRLKNALTDLLASKHFDDITLTDISQRADVTRVTFYGHYQDKYELLEDVIAGVLEGFSRAAGREREHGGERLLAAMLTYIDKNKPFFYTMLGSRRAAGFIPQFIACIEEIYRDVLVPADDRIDREILRKYVTSATLGVLSFWVKSGMKLSPAYLTSQLMEIESGYLKKWWALPSIIPFEAEDRKEDRRVVRTKGQLKEAFLKILGEKDLPSVTITEICQRANYHRAAFYAHYKNKEALARELVNEKTASLIGRMWPPSGNHADAAEFGFVRQIFFYVREEKDFFRLIFSERPAPGFLSQFRDMLEDFFRIRVEWLAKVEDAERVDGEVLVHYLTFSIMGLMSYWIRSGLACSPDYLSNQVALIMAQQSKYLEFG